MPDNPAKDYKDYILANLPSDVTVDPKDGFFIYNNHKFPTWLQVKWYRDYIRKYRRQNTILSVTGAIKTDFTRNNVRYTQFEFTQSGTVNLVGDLAWINIALAGGGATGARGSGTTYIPGGGGAGRLLLSEGQSFLADNYTFTLGAGAPATSNLNGQTNGSPSSLVGGSLNLVAPGGGRGGWAQTGFAISGDGGSSGGERSSASSSGGVGVVIPGTGIIGLGNTGGTSVNTSDQALAASSGGGGAGGPGGNSELGVPGNGGLGYTIPWLSTPLNVCRGGAGTMNSEYANTPNETYGSGTKGTNTGTVGKAGDGFMFIVVKTDEVTIL